LGCFGWVLWLWFDGFGDELVELVLVDWEVVVFELDV